MPRPVLNRTAAPTPARASNRAGRGLPVPHRCGGWCRRAPAGVGTGQRGFTLLELGIAVVAFAILAAIAFPAYRLHIQRSRLGEGVAALANRRALMEQYFLNNRTYVGGPCTTSITVGAFTVVCSTTPTASTYTIIATGSGSAAGAVYTVDHHGDARTTGLPSGWGTPPSGGYPCWVTRKGDLCGSSG